MAVDPGGDVEAAAELYDCYAAGQVYALTRRIVGNETDAEDVVQERRPSRTSSRSVDGGACSSSTSRSDGGCTPKGPATARASNRTPVTVRAFFISSQHFAC